MALAPSSPRLPSPPPPTEIQIGPQSPSLGKGTPENVIEQSIIEANSARRIHPGTRASEMAAGPPLIPLGELDSAFQLQEHLKALHYYHTKPSNSSHTFPITRASAKLIAEPPEGVDRNLWLYELCRFLINKCNDLIIGFLFDSPPCSATTCPEMRASEWQFLCAVHDAPKSCCAIDYCCHTLDWAAGIVTSQKHFPSRLSLGGSITMDEGGNNVKHLVNIFRRLHRIFAHAWFQHMGVFWQVEGQTGLYVLFKTVCDLYDLLPAENYKLPPEAEGLEPLPETKAAPTILKGEGTSSNVARNNESDDPTFMGINRTNTRRHIRSSPSTGAAVTTVLEAEEDDSDVASKLGSMQLVDSSSQNHVEVQASNEMEDQEDVENEEAEITILADTKGDDAAQNSPEVEAISELTNVNLQSPVASAQASSLEDSSKSKPGVSTQATGTVQHAESASESEGASELEEPKIDVDEETPEHPPVVDETKNVVIEG